MKKSAQLDSRTTEKKQPSPVPPGVAFKPPLKRRRGLFFFLLGAVGVWMGVLLTLYFVTVYPNRARHTDPLPSEAPARSSPR